MATLPSRARGSRAARWIAALALVLGVGAVARPAGAQRVLVDRVAVRFWAPETGGTRSPRLIYERVLAFEARLEALADPDGRSIRSVAYRERHVRAALERHVAETLLASLHIEPEPTEAELVRATEAARLVLEQRVGGAGSLQEAARVEGIERRELMRILRRQARASIYLDRMVAPMLAPSERELRHAHRAGLTPFGASRFEEVAEPLRRWYVGRRLAEALATYFQGVRSRLELVVLDPQR